MCLDQDRMRKRREKEEEYGQLEAEMMGGGVEVEVGGGLAEWRESESPIHGLGGWKHISDQSPPDRSTV